MRGVRWWDWRYWHRSIQRAIDCYRPARKVVRVEDDSLPPNLPARDLVLCQEGDEKWCVGMRCPCGCGKVIELLLLQNTQPRWDLIIDRQGRPSLFPSVWVQTGCRSHFWIRNGRVVWCYS